MMTGSTAIDSANPPVRHMPIAPTPGPPHSVCACRASALSQSVIGLLLFAASMVNSREMHSPMVRPSVTFSGFAASGVPSRIGA